MNNLLVGCGSIGKRHLKKLIDLNQKIWVIDPNIETRNFALSQSELVLGAFPTIEKFLESKSMITLNIAVIANWGPDHFYTFEKINTLMPKKILIEKPVTSKLSDLYRIKTFLGQSKTSFLVNYHLRFDSSFKQLEKLCSQDNFGTPLLISVVGGAKCMSTNGIHWIDFSNQLIGSEWDTINSLLTPQLINPRSKDLNFYEGFTNIMYKNGSSVSINLTNSSYMDLQITIVWREAKGVIVNGELTLYGPQEKIPIDQPITRSALFSKVISVTPFPKDGFDNLYIMLDQEKVFVMENALIANELLLLSLISAKTRDPLTSNEKIKNDLIDFDWKIS